MGNRSGRHALHCGVAARAHLIVLPFFRFTSEVIEEVAHGEADGDGLPRAGLRRDEQIAPLERLVEDSR